MSDYTSSRLRYVDAEVTPEPRRCVVPELVGVPVVFPPPPLRLFCVEAVRRRQGFQRGVSDRTAVAGGVVAVSW